MFGGISIVNEEAWKKCLAELKTNPGTAVPFSAEHFGLPPFEMKPLPGFKFPDKFPLCCPNHIQLMDIANGYYSLFPNCCDPHKKLSEANWFNKEGYSYLPHKIVNSLLYATHAVEQLINGRNWFKDITDYLDGTVRSFGQLPEGYGPPPGLSLFINNMILRINSLSVVPDEKQEPIQQYIQKNYFEGSKSSTSSKSSVTDFNILLGTYRKWLKIFPFDIVPFNALKKDFANRLPIVSGCIDVNRFTQTATATLANQKQLLEFLVDTTKLILDNADTPGAISNGRISDLDRLNFERLSASHRLAQTALLGKHTKGELQYISILKKWLSNEKEYLKEIKALNIPKEKLQDKKQDMDFSFQPHNAGQTFDFNNEAIKKIMATNQYLQCVNFQIEGQSPADKPAPLNLAGITDLESIKDIHQVGYLFSKQFKPQESFPGNISVNEFYITDLIYRLYIHWCENDYRKSPNKKALIDSTLLRWRKDVDLANHFAEMNYDLSGKPTRDIVRTGYKHFFQGKNPGLLDRYNDFKKEIEDESSLDNVANLFTLDFIANYEKSKHAIDSNQPVVPEDFQRLREYDERIGFLVQLHLSPVYNLFQYCWGFALAKAVKELEERLESLNSPKLSDFSMVEVLQAKTKLAMESLSKAIPVMQDRQKQLETLLKADAASEKVSDKTEMPLIDTPEKAAIYESLFHSKGFVTGTNHNIFFNLLQNASLICSKENNYALIRATLKTPMQPVWQYFFCGSVYMLCKTITPSAHTYFDDFFKEMEGRCSNRDEFKKNITPYIKITDKWWNFFDIERKTNKTASAESVKSQIETLQTIVPVEKFTPKIKEDRFSEYQSLEDVFKDQYKHLIEDCIQILRETEPRTINDEYSFFSSGIKGAVLIWYNELEKKGLINSITDRKKKAHILNSKFSGLNVSDSLFNQENKRAKDLFTSLFSSHFAALKHK